MNLKKKLREFVSLAPKSNGGFTLVELIVVIAILAILAGVAVPAYGGYVEKANRAADEQLLSAVNTAFAAACAVNGEDHYNRTDKPALVANGKAVDTVSVFSEEFDNFFEGNDSEFKVMEISELFYDPLFGGFVEDYSISLKVGDTTYSVSKKALQDYQGSYYAGMDVGDLTSNVDKAVQFAVEKVNTALNGDYTKLEGFEELLTDLGMEDATDEQKANALVLYAAQNSGGMDAEALYSAIYNNSGSMTVPYGANDGEKTAAAAAQYALGMAFVRDYNKEKGYEAGDANYVDPENVQAVLDALEFREMETDLMGNSQPATETTYFQEWLNQNGKDNLNGYLGMMDMISTNTANGTLDTNTILTNGYNSEEVNEILAGLLNGTT